MEIIGFFFLFGYVADPPDLIMLILGTSSEKTINLVYGNM